jgi:hypothetical protein
MNATATRLLLPVGQYLGPRRVDRRASHDVRCGIHRHELDPTRARVWLAAHAPLALPDPWPDPRQAIAKIARLESGECATVIAALLDAGLLIDLDPDDFDAIDFAMAHRLAPLLTGLGEPDDAPGWLTVGVPGSPVGVLPPLARDVWVWASAAETLWDLCKALAAVECEMESSDTEPGDLLPDVLGCLGPIMGIGAGYLDSSARGR